MPEVHIKRTIVELRNEDGIGLMISAKLSNPLPIFRIDFVSKSRASVGIPSGVLFSEDWPAIAGLAEKRPARIKELITIKQANLDEAN